MNQNTINNFNGGKGFRGIVTVCKRINLIFCQKFLTFCDDIRAELYLKINNFGYLPKRICTLL